MFVCELASQWRTVHYLARHMEVLKCLKLLPLNLVPCACADESKHAEINFLLWYLKVWSIVSVRL